MSHCQSETGTGIDFLVLEQGEVLSGVRVKSWIPGISAQEFLWRTEQMKLVLARYKE